MKRKIWIFGVVAIVGVAVAFGFMRQGKKDGTPVFMHQAESGEIRSQVIGTGEIQARTRVNVGAQIPGTIVSIPVKEGEAVKRGQVLLKIDPEQYVQEVQNLEAQLRRARVAVEQEKVRLANFEARERRSAALRRESLISDEAYDEARLQLDASKIEMRSLDEAVTQAEAALNKAKDDLNKTTIYAPMDGKVTALNTEVGEQVIVGTTNIPGSVMMVVSDMSEVLAEVDVDESRIAQVTVGQSVAVKVDAVDGVTYHGTVHEIRNSARKKGEANVFGVKVLLADADAQLRPGMTAKARIAIETRRGVVRVPIQAVVERTPNALGDPSANAGKGGDRIDALVVVENGKAKAVKVETGLSDDDFIEIRAGVSAGQQVVTGPYRQLRKLKDGEAIVEKHDEAADADGPDVVVD